MLAAAVTLTSGCTVTIYNVANTPAPTTAGLQVVEVPKIVEVVKEKVITVEKPIYKEIQKPLCRNILYVLNKPLFDSESAKQHLEGDSPLVLVKELLRYIAVNDTLIKEAKQDETCR